jgi:hypothetical protein
MNWVCQLFLPLYTGGISSSGGMMQNFYLTLLNSWSLARFPEVPRVRISRTSGKGHPMQYIVTVPDVRWRWAILCSTLWLCRMFADDGPSYAVHCDCAGCSLTMDHPMQYIVTVRDVRWRWAILCSTLWLCRMFADDVSFTRRWCFHSSRP